MLSKPKLKELDFSKIDHNILFSVKKAKYSELLIGFFLVYLTILITVVCNNATKLFICSVDALKQGDISVYSTAESVYHSMG